MDKKNLIAIGSLCFVVSLLVGSYFAYNYLVPKYNEGTEAQQNKPESVTEIASKKIKYYDIIGENYEGEKSSLSDYVGEDLVVVNFWASWCTWCEKEMPEFYEASQEYKDDGVIFVMVNATDGNSETKDIAKKFLEEGGYPFENVLYDVKHEITTKYGFPGLPVTMFIDKDGYIVDIRNGAMDGETLRNSIDKHIKK